MPGFVARHVQQLLQERRGAAADRTAIVLDAAYAVFRRPDIDEHAARAAHPGHVERPERAGDMADRAMA